MIANASRTIVVSSLGWVDAAALWIFDAAAPRAAQLTLGSGARYLSLHTGAADHFAVAHHFAGARCEITVHSFAEPSRVLGRAALHEQGSEFSGDPGVWQHVPLIYTAYLRFTPWDDYVLLVIEPAAARVTIQKLGWYDQTYDKPYQSVVGALQAPGERWTLVAVQRSSALVVHDLATGQKIGAVDLGGGSGNPQLAHRASANEIWARDYDALVVLDRRTRRVLRRRRLQGAPFGTQQFVGDFSFNRDETRCLVARPFSGDVVELDAARLRITRAAKLGEQPLEVMALGDEDVVARDWKTGGTLLGTLTRRGRRFWQR
jgi:hypothetical protein